MKKEAITTVRIMGMEIKVVPNKRIAVERFAAGEYNQTQCEIAIATDMAPSLQGEVLVHEIIEAVNARLDIDMPHDKLTALASGLYAVICDNPKTMLAIMGGKPIVGVPDNE